MPKQSSSECCSATGGFHVDAVINVDERGQMVLPKDVRERAGIQPGDKLALITWQKDGEVCCMSLVKTTALAEMVKGLLGPMVQEIGVG
jgi:AbrB family looped-hinge helix DNA binding protein